MPSFLIDVLGQTFLLNPTFLSHNMVGWNQKNTILMNRGNIACYQNINIFWLKIFFPQNLLKNLESKNFLRSFSPYKKQGKKSHFNFKKIILFYKNPWTKKIFFENIFFGA